MDPKLTIKGTALSIEKPIVHFKQLQVVNLEFVHLSNNLLLLVHVFFK